MGGLTRTIAAVLRRMSPRAWMAVGLFLIVSAAVAGYGRNERSGWILMTSPEGYDHRANTMLGYCWLRDGEPFMKENIPCVTQTAVFGGALQALETAEYREDFRFIRGFYSFVASLLTPMLDVVPAMLVVNWLAWGTCAAVSWRLAHELAGSETAGLIAAAFATAGIGMTIHVGDYSPHLLAFATYYLGVYLLVRSGVWREAQAFRVHAALGLYMALACLTYNTGVMLVAVYLVSAIRRNAFRHLAAAAAIALSARPLWRQGLGATVVDIEAEYFSRSMEAWRELLSGNPVVAAKTMAGWASELVMFFDSPGVVLAGLACCFTARLPARLRVVGGAAVAMPFLAAFVFAPAATARGYLVYAGTVWIYACLGAQLAVWLQDPRAWTRRGSGVVAALLFASQLGWSTAHLWHQLGPAKTYFLGWDDGWAYFADPTEVVSLTGAEPVPVLFGGRTTLVEAGAAFGPVDHQLTKESAGVGVALLSRGFFVVYLLALVVVASEAKRRIAAGGVVLGGFIIVSASSSIGIRSVPAFFPVDYAVVIPGGGTLRYEVALSPETRKQLAAMRGDDVVGFFFRSSMADDVEVSFLADGKPLSVARDGGPDHSGFYRLGMSNDEAAMLGKTKRLTLEIANPQGEPALLSGWQRTDLPARSLVVSGPDSSNASAPLAFPAFEIRIAGRDGHLRFVGF